MVTRTGSSHVFAAVAAIGLGLALLEGCAEARAVAVVPAGRLDQVRLGFGLGLDGCVSPGCTASTFALGDPIHLSMKVSGAPPGATLSATVRDTVTQRIAWSAQSPVAPGVSHVTFEIGRTLAQGRYRAESTLGGEPTGARDFVVHARSASAN